jgi:PAS domain S-box-containing protein
VSDNTGHKRANPLYSKETWLPLIVFFILLSGVIMLWQEAKQDEWERLQLETEITADHLRIRLETWIDARTGIIRHLGDEWLSEYINKESQYTGDATRLLALFHGFQALNWIDADWFIRIVVPREGNEPALGKDLHNHPNEIVRTALSRAVNSNDICRTTPIDLLQGGKGIATYLGVRDAGGGIIGFINGVFRIDKLVESCLSEESLRQRFRFRLLEENGEVVISHGPDQGVVAWPHSVEVKVRIIDRHWTLMIASSEALLAQNSTLAIKFMQPGGILLVILVSFLVRLLLLRHKAVKESELSFRTLFNSGPVGLSVSTFSGKSIMWNDIMTRITGYTLNDLKNKNLADIYADPEDREELLRELEVKDRVQNHVLKMKRKDGSQFYASLTMVPLSFKGDTILLTAVLDITERRKLEEERLNLERQVQQAQKLESLGVLAGGIAHDFNNILMTIIGNADLVLQDLPFHVPTRNNIKEIEKAARRAAGLAKQILAYSGKGKFVVETICLNEFFDEMAHLLEVSISKRTKLQYNFTENLPVFEGDPTQVRQIILNLITNASEAIGEEDGTIYLTTGLMECDSHFLDTDNAANPVGIDDPLPPGPYVFLEVVDTGCGMDADTQIKIFDPFFTTKFTGRGLGMAAVLGIIRGHRGVIKIKSEVGKGTTFRILLPVSTDAVIKEKKPKPKRELLPDDWHGSGTILIVDDEDSICAVGRKMLERLGFAVLTAGDGIEALAVFEKHSAEINCVLLDLTMPRMDGEQTFKELRLIYSDLKIILCSGYDEQEATRHFTGMGLAGFLQKPYQFKVLKQKLREIFTED